MGCALSRRTTVVDLSTIVLKQYQPMMLMKSQGQRKMHFFSQSQTGLPPVQEDPGEHELSIMSQQS